MELEKSYRNEMAYTQMIKQFLYNNRPKFKQRTNNLLSRIRCLPGKRTFTVDVLKSEEEFLNSFIERTEANTIFLVVWSQDIQKNTSVTKTQQSTTG